MVIKQTHQKRWFVSVVSVQGAADERLEFNRAALYCRKVAFAGGFSVLHTAGIAQGMLAFQKALVS